MNKKRIAVYFGLYTMIVGIAILSLMLNINAVPLHKEKVELTKAIKLLDEENRILELKIAKANSLSQLEALSKSSYPMIKPKKIHYIP